MVGQLKLPELPLFITARNKYWVGFIGFVVCAVLYLVPNHFPFFPPRQLEMTPWDKAVPFIPQTVLIYATEYLFFIAIYLTSKNIRNLNKYYYSFIFQQIVAVVIFVLWPTVYPRELFPLVRDQMDGFTYFVFDLLRQSDSPTNCLPSLHVSSVFVSAFIYLDEQREKFWFFFTWAALIAISTLPTKQHYIIDVGAGFALAVCSYFLFHKVLRFKSDTVNPLT